MNAVTRRSSWYISCSFKLGNWEELLYIQSFTTHFSDNFKICLYFCPTTYKAILGSICHSQFKNNCFLLGAIFTELWENKKQLHKKHCKKSYVHSWTFKRYWHVVYLDKKCYQSCEIWGTIKYTTLLAYKLQRN